MQRIKLQGTALTRKGNAALQRLLDKLEKWADMDLVKLNKDKSKILPLGWMSPLQRQAGQQLCR